MNLYIEIENGTPKNHPAFESNLIAACGQIPDHWEPFVRVIQPTPGVYQILESTNSTYAKVDDVWTDVWPLREMTPEEKATKQQDVRNAFNNRPQAENWSAWVLDEATCTMQPPIPRPALDETKIKAGVFTFWCGAENGWKDSPAKPVDDNQYKFDFLAWEWVQVVN